MRKRILNLVIVGCLILGIMNSVELNVAAGGTTMLSDDFQTNLTKWTTTQAPALKDATATIVADPVTANSGNTVLKILANSGITAGDKNRIYPVPNISFAAGSKLAMQFDFYIPVTNGISQFRLGNLLLSAGNVQYNGTVASAFVKDRWNTCMMYYDYDGKIGKAYLNGTEIASDTNLDTTKVNTYLYPSWMAADNVIFLDNVSFVTPSTQFNFVSSTEKNATVSLNSLINLQFDNTVDKASLDTITVKRTDDQSAVSISKKYMNNNKVILQLASDLVANKSYTVDFSSVKNMFGTTLTSGDNSITIYADKYNMRTIRNDTFEGYNTGTVWANNAIGTTSMPKKSIDSTNFPVYLAYNGAPASDLSGTIYPVLSTLFDMDLVSTSDGASGTTQALKVISKNAYQNAGAIAFSNATGSNLTVSTKYIYKARVRSGDGDGTNGFNKAIFGCVYFNFDTQTLAIEDRYVASPDNNGIYCNVLPAKGTWFDFTYELDIPAKTVSVFINGNFKGSRTFAETTITSTANLFTVNGSKWNFATYQTQNSKTFYLDNVSVFTQDLAPEISVVSPLFKTSANVVMSAINVAGNITATVNVVNRSGANVSGNVIAVVKHLGSITDVVIANIPSTATGTISTDVPIALNIPADLGYSVNLYFWDGLTNIKPLYYKYSIANSNGNFVKL